VNTLIGHPWLVCRNSVQSRREYSFHRTIRDS